MSADNVKIKPNPDFERFDRVLRRQGVPDRVPFYELFSNIESSVLRTIGKTGEDMAAEFSDHECQDWELQRHINYMFSLGYEGISWLLYDDEHLLSDIFRAVATRIIEYFDTLAALEVVGALTLGDDMGFKTQTLLSPQVYRKYLFPWHIKLVQTVHRHDKPIILHSCGNLSEIMEDIIHCGWDAKHSFEDVIEPVWETKRKYGDRIAVLGGFDINKMSRMSEKEIRAHTRFLIEKCAPGGGSVLGTGNSVANYVPVQNFLAML